jgi:hypothetical protein
MKVNNEDYSEGTPEIHLHLCEKLSIFLANFFKIAAKKRKATHPFA